MGYHSILVGTDGSETAAVAEAVAARLARQLRAGLRIVTGFELERTTRRAARQVLEGARARALERGVEAEVEAEEGEPAEVVLHLAEARAADLVVLGNRGMGRAKRFRLGSVPDRIAHFAPCDVLIVNTTNGRPREEEAQDDDRIYRRMIIGTDGSPTASEAARKGFELGMLVHAKVTLVYVGDPVVGAIVLERTAKDRPRTMKPDTRLADGDPAEAISDIAETEGFDLIVVGNKGMAGTRRFFLGSVPNKVAHYSPTDVLIAKTVGLGLEDIAPGHGGVVDVDGKRMAVFRDESGAVHAVSPRCTHMGCTVDWNDAERTWDCPCHGSRYATGGEVIRGPATKGLASQRVKA